MHKILCVIRAPAIVLRATSPFLALTIVLLTCSLPNRLRSNVKTRYLRVSSLCSSFPSIKTGGLTTLLFRLHQITQALSGWILPLNSVHQLSSLFSSSCTDSTIACLSFPWRYTSTSSAELRGRTGASNWLDVMPTLYTLNSTGDRADPWSRPGVIVF